MYELLNIWEWMFMIITPMLVPIGTTSPSSKMSLYPWRSTCITHHHKLCLNKILSFNLGNVRAQEFTTFYLKHEQKDY